MDKTISVIIPMYNYGRYLRDALDSVLEQSVKAHEIICVSDGAVDDSVQIVKEYQKKHNIILIEKENGGLASARNAGIRASTGKYFMSFDSDDIMKPDCLKEHLKLADEKSIVTCGLMAFGDETYTAVPSKATVPVLLQTNVIYSNSLVPKKIWEEVGGYDESEIMRKGLEDWEFWIRVAEAGADFKTSTYIALLWRRHGGTMSNQSANPNWTLITNYFRKKHKNLYKKYSLK